MSRAEMMRLVKKLRKQGFDVERTGSGHWMVKSPDGKGRTVLAFSPGSNGFQTTKHQLRKLGFVE